MGAPSSSSQRTPIELTASFRPRPAARHAVFDFDGTLSLVRGGWAEVMLAMFVERAPAPTGISRCSWREILADDIRRLAGKPTSHQMERYVMRVAEHGHTVESAACQLAEFRRRLADVIAGRIAAVRAGTLSVQRLAVPGAGDLLAALTARGLTLHLVSGTEESAVREEAALLGFSRYFGERIHGPRHDGDGFTKRVAIERIATEAGGNGDQLISFGDGPIEISDTRRVGGLAIAVASEESGNRPGEVDAAKRALLLEVGADAVIPDYHDMPALLAAIFGATPGKGMA